MSSFYSVNEELSFNSPFSSSKLLIPLLCSNDQNFPTEQNVTVRQTLFEAIHLHWKHFPQCSNNVGKHTAAWMIIFTLWPALAQYFFWNFWLIYQQISHRKLHTLYPYKTEEELLSNFMWTFSLATWHTNKSEVSRLHWYQQKHDEETALPVLNQVPFFENIWKSYQLSFAWSFSMFLSNFYML